MSSENEVMRRIAPELNSQYASYPLKRNLWLDSYAQAPGGQPAFIPHPKSTTSVSEPLKDDYVFGGGPQGWGYYHLLTRDAYKTLNVRLRSNAPVNCCLCFSSETDKEYYRDYSEVASIVYNRSIASRPDDALAAREAINIARGVAQSSYHTDQNIQLILMAL